ncbi:hypothetical protein B0H19DRAFT_1085200 [Mycena capillaripes]|nr:hypothetical protein B0H19DRAFT_1085200 [Mycena capillaripes]
MIVSIPSARKTVKITPKQGEKWSETAPKPTGHWPLRVKMNKYRNEILQHFEPSNELGFFMLLNVYELALQHPTVCTAPVPASVPPAVIGPTPKLPADLVKLFSVWYIEMQMAFRSRSPRGGSLARRSHTYPAPHLFSSAPYQNLKDMYTCIESPHLNTNSELAKCRVPPPSRPDTLLRNVISYRRPARKLRGGGAYSIQKLHGSGWPQVGSEQVCVYLAATRESWGFCAASAEHPQSMGSLRLIHVTAPRLGGSRSIACLSAPTRALLRDAWDPVGWLHSIVTRAEHSLVFYGPTGAREGLVIWLLCSPGQYFVHWCTAAQVKFSLALLGITANRTNQPERSSGMSCIAKPDRASATLQTYCIHILNSRKVCNQINNGGMYSGLKQDNISQINQSINFISESRQGSQIVQKEFRP